MNFVNQSEEAFLMEFLLYVNYLMSLVLEELLPNPSPLLDEKTMVREFKIQYRVLSNQIKHIFNDTVMPIIKQNRDTPFTEEEIIRFSLGTKAITQTLQRNMEISDLAELDMSVLEIQLAKIKDNVIVDPQGKKLAMRTVEVLLDYYSIFMDCYNNKKDVLLEMLNKMDIDGLKNSLYGVLLTLTCVSFMLSTEKLYSNKKFLSIVKYGDDYTKALASNIETLDMLANPDANRLSFEQFLKENINNQQYQNKYVAFVNGKFQNFNAKRSQLVVEMYNQFGNVEMLVEKISNEEEELLLDSPE